MALGINWRDAMPIVHSAIDRLVNEEVVRLSWKGHPLAKRDGPYRIGRGSRFPLWQGKVRSVVSHKCWPAT